MTCSFLGERVQERTGNTSRSAVSTESRTTWLTGWTSDSLKSPYSEEHKRTPWLLDDSKFQNVQKVHNVHSALFFSNLDMASADAMCTRMCIMCTFNDLRALLPAGLT